MQKGIFSAIAAYTIWGLLPIYLKLLQSIAPLEVLLNRMIWSMIFVSLILLATRHFEWVGQVRKNPKILLVFLVTAIAIALNWFTYIWAVTAGRVVDASLGYFILPLVSIIFGYFFLHERLRFGQWMAVLVAFLGVMWLIIDVGQVPWIAIILAVSFAIYSLLRKIAHLEALAGFAFETFILAPFALMWLIFLANNNQSAFIFGDNWTRFLLIISGPITATPLLFFSFAARRIPLYMLGFLQYIGPTLQLLLGIFLWHEDFPTTKMIGFAIIWSALLIYSLETVWFSRFKKNLLPNTISHS